MTINNGHLTNHLGLYQPTQPFVKHDLPLWVEEEEEEEDFYRSSPYPFFTLESIVGSRKLDEDYLIDNLFKNQPPVAMQIDDREDESLGKPENDPLVELFTTNSNQVLEILRGG